MSLRQYFLHIQISGRSVSHEDVKSYADTDTEPEIKKKRIQKINNTESAKGKGVGKKKNKKICDEKENKSPSPIAHCSRAFEAIRTETNNLPASDNDQEQRNDRRDIEVEKVPVVLTEDLQFYEEIVIPWNEPTDLKATNVTEETNLIEIENEHASTSTTNVPNIIINSNTKIASEKLTKLLPKNPTKQT